MRRTVTRANPNGVPVASPASRTHRTALGAAATALAWTARGYVVTMTAEPDTLEMRIRERTAMRPG